MHPSSPPPPSAPAPPTARLCPKRRLVGEEVVSCLRPQGHEGTLHEAAGGVTWLDPLPGPRPSTRAR